MTPVTWAEVIARRLERSSLAPRTGELVDAVAGVGGVQAQLQSSAELQLASRVDGIAQADVRAALWERRELVKAWTLRGTLHLHPAAELPLWHAARRAVAVDDRSLPVWRDPDGNVHPALGAEQVAEVRTAVRDVLDGRCLLREEIVEEVVARVGPKPRARLSSGFAFFLGDLCQGPPRGAKVTFARPDQWVDGWHEPHPAQALREAARRFLQAYGPARPKDFLEWFGGSRAPFDEIEVDEVDVEGRAAFVLAGDTEFSQPSDSVRLLPEYDAYVMGFRERAQLIPPEVRAQVAEHGRGRYEGPAGVRFVLVDGVTAGTWNRAKRGKRFDVHLRLIRRLTKPQRDELQAEVARIGAFLGLEPVLTID
ncbi:MAG TPA: winged helix DNA-binding domain-containing protein [Gaiellaceae bacterium]|nr:winged helix DNA-binding domain-containing protein [Gaiellaceae bacterium]